jgi:DNA-binding MarR family transcriptional regulator
MTAEGKKFSKTEVYLLHNIVYNIDCIAEEILMNALGIKYTDFLILMHTDALVSTSQEILSGHMNLSKSAVSKRIASLVNGGLLNRVENPTNRRENIIELTEKGISVVKNAYSILTNTSEPFMKVIQDRRLLVDLLTKINDRIKTNNDICE